MVNNGLTRAHVAAMSSTADAWRREAARGQELAPTKQKARSRDRALISIRRTLSGGFVRHGSGGERRSRRLRSTSSTKPQVSHRERVPIESQKAARRSWAALSIFGEQLIGKKAKRRPPGGTTCRSCRRSDSGQHGIDSRHRHKTRRSRHWPRGRGP
jgi:hypothetical protein